MPPSLPRAQPARLVCLAGFMGCGKTTAGAMLARQLAWRFEDLDTRIEEYTGLRVQAIFERLGEAAFRRIESEQLGILLGRAVESHEPMVLALGGGTYAQPGATERLRAAGAIVVWLDCPVELLLARCATMSNRPLFRDESSFRALLASRLPFYEQADHRVDAGGDPAAVVERILRLRPFVEWLPGSEEESLPRKAQPR